MKDMSAELHTKPAQATVVNPVAKDLGIQKESRTLFLFFDSI
jgi:hypothetical protein